MLLIKKLEILKFLLNFDDFFFGIYRKHTDYRVYMPIAHKAIFLLLHQWHKISTLDFELHPQFRKEISEFLNKAAQLGDPYQERVNLLRGLFLLPVSFSSSFDF